MPDMRHRQLGDSELHVSEVGLGSWLTYSGGRRPRPGGGVHARGLRRRDQLPRHGERLRRAARPRRCWARSSRARPRDRYVLATKLYFPMSEQRPGAFARAGPQADRRVADAAAHRLRRPLPVPPLRHRDAARGDDAGADRGRPRRQGALLGVQRVDALSRSTRRARARAGAREVRLEPAAVLAAVAPPEDGVIPLSAEQRDLAGRLVAARAGRADGQVPPGDEPPEDTRAASEEMGGFDRGLPPRRRARGGPAAEADRRGARGLAGAARARLDAARGQRGERDHRRDAAGAGRRERGAVRPSSSAMTSSRRSTRRSGTPRDWETNRRARPARLPAFRRSVAVAGRRLGVPPLPACGRPAGLRRAGVRRRGLGPAAGAGALAAARPRRAGLHQHAPTRSRSTRRASPTRTRPATTGATSACPTDWPATGGRCCASRASTRARGSGSTGWSSAYSTGSRLPTEFDVTGALLRPAARTCWPSACTSGRRAATSRTRTCGGCPASSARSSCSSARPAGIDDVFVHADYDHARRRHAARRRRACRRGSSCRSSASTSPAGETVDGRRSSRGAPRCPRLYDATVVQRGARRCGCGSASARSRSPTACSRSTAGGCCSAASTGTSSTPDRGRALHRGGHAGATCC